MKTKQLLVLVGVLVVLGLLVLVLENPFGKSEREKKVEAALPLFPDFKRDSVTRFEITALGETTALVKEGDQWLVASMDNYPADAEAVDEMFDKVAGFKTVDLVSANPEKQSVFQVDASGTEAKLLDANDNVLAHLFIGKTTPGVFSSYIRAAHSNNVYTGEGYLKATFDKGYRTWKDRTIFNFNKGDATHLSINSEEEEIELQLDAEGKWQMLKPTASAVSQTEIDSLLDKLSSLETDDFEEEEDPEEYDLDDPRATVTARLNDGTTRTLLVGKQEEGNDRNPVKREDKPQIFMLYSANLDSLLKKSTDLKEEAPVAEFDAESGTAPVDEAGADQPIE